MIQSDHFLSHVYWTLVYICMYVVSIDLRGISYVNYVQARQLLL